MGGLGALGWGWVGGRRLRAPSVLRLGQQVRAALVPKVQKPCQLLFPTPPHLTRLPSPAHPHPPPRRLLDRLAGRALRLLACAVKTDLGDLADYDGTEAHKGHRRLADTTAYAALESDLVFLGLTGLQDPPRPEVRCAGLSGWLVWCGRCMSMRLLAGWGVGEFGVDDPGLAALPHHTALLTRWPTPPTHPPTHPPTLRQPTGAIGH